MNNRDNRTIGYAAEVALSVFAAAKAAKALQSAAKVVDKLDKALPDSKGAKLLDDLKDDPAVRAK